MGIATLTTYQYVIMVDDAAVLALKVVHRTVKLSRLSNPSRIQRRSRCRFRAPAAGSSRG